MSEANNNRLHSYLKYSTIALVSLFGLFIAFIIWGCSFKGSENPNLSTNDNGYNVTVNVKGNHALRNLSTHAPFTHMIDNHINPSGQENRFVEMFNPEFTVSGQGSTKRFNNMAKAQQYIDENMNNK